MNIWPYIIALLLIFLYKKRGAITQVFRYRRVKNVFEKTKNEYISLRVQEMTLRMDDTINTMNDIIEDLQAFKPHLSGHKLDVTEGLIETATILQEEYQEIKIEIGNPTHNQESLNAIEKKLNMFIIKLNNQLAVGVKQLRSKIKGDIPEYTR